ncbi:MAG: (Fe-S)-binding protein [Saprospiraceae bacterium]
MVQQILFIAILVLTIFVSVKTYSQIISNIKLGREFETGQSLRTMTLIALGQGKMFKNFIPAIFHLFIYVAFLFTQIELIEILIDGVSGSHRIFAPYLGGFYTFLISFIELLSVLAFIATLVFLSRRNILKVERFHKPEMKGWPFVDGNLILLGEILLIVGLFTANSSDLVLQSRLPERYHHTGGFLVSSFLSKSIFSHLSTNVLIFLERMGWWLHVMVVLGFIVYLTISKHLHLIFAFFNTYFAPLTHRGSMENMPVIMNEVKSMMGLTEETEQSGEEEIPEFGANDIKGLTWKNILDAYTCTECGRCTAACPANITGKLLSPRKIVMSVRDRADEIGNKIASGDKQYFELSSENDKPSISNFNDGKSLFDFISDEEIFACTTCNACVEECPVLINPLDIILQMRRYRILNDSAGPQDWMSMFTSLENSGSVWQMSEEREAWINI